VYPGGMRTTSMWQQPTHTACVVCSGVHSRLCRQQASLQVTGKSAGSQRPGSTTTQAHSQQSGLATVAHRLGCGTKTGCELQPHGKLPHCSHQSKGCTTRCAASCTTRRTESTTPTKSPGNTANRTERSSETGLPTPHRSKPGQGGPWLCGATATQRGAHKTQTHTQLGDTPVPNTTTDREQERGRDTTRMHACTD
jgi:hypothetical protein